MSPNQDANQDANPDPTLNILIKNGMTTWPTLYQGYYEQRFAPVPCFNTELNQRYYEPEPNEWYQVPTSLGDCRQSAIDQWWAVDSIKRRFLKWKFELEKHFGAVVSNEPYQSYPHCFQHSLHNYQPLLPAASDEASRENQKQICIRHLRRCEVSAQNLMLQVKDALEMLPQLQQRYQEIKLWTQEALKKNTQDDVAPQRLRVLFLEANEWLCVITGALRGFLGHWKEAKVWHETNLDLSWLPTERRMDPNALKAIWEVRNKRNNEIQGKKFPAAESLPLSREELWVISMRQQGDDIWQEMKRSEGKDLSNDVVDVGL